MFLYGSTTLHTLIATLFVLVYGGIFIYIPAHNFLANYRLNRFSHLSAALVLGLSSYGFLVYLVRFIGLPFFFTEIFICIILYLQKPKIHLKPRFSFSSHHLLLFLVITFSALVQSAVLIRSGIFTQNGLRFVELSFHDSMQHLSIIRRLYQSSQLPHPGFAGSVLTNYHYLIDIILASLTRFRFISLIDTYYRVYPIGISVIFSLSLYAFSRFILKSKTLALLAVIFTVFAGNASYYVHFYRPIHFTWGANTFMINPLVDILQNPASIFVLAQLLTTLLLIAHFSRFSSTAKRFKYLIAISLITGTMVGFKAWGGILISAGLIAVFIFDLVKTKSLRFLPLLISSAIVSSLIFFPHYMSQTSASPEWAPLWTLERMIRDPDRWNNLEDYFRLQHFQHTHSPRLYLLYAKWFAIYLIGNYWLRLIGLLAIFSLILKRKTLKHYQILLLTITSLSLTIPLLFNQGRMAYDIEQFSPYALLLASIYFFLPFSNFPKFINRPKLKPLVWILLLLAISLTLPSNYPSIKARTTGKTNIITFQELEAYHKVNQLTPPDSSILLFTSHRNTSTLEFAAFTDRNTFYSGGTLAVITGEDYQKRQKQLQNIYQPFDTHKFHQFIVTHHPDYLFLYQEDFNYVDPEALKLEPIYTNQAASLYKLYR